MSTDREKWEVVARNIVINWHREVAHFYDLCESDSPLIEAIADTIEAAVAQALNEERKGWPTEQPLTDVPMGRQIVQLNQQLSEKQAEIDRIQGDER